MPTFRQISLHIETMDKGRRSGRREEQLKQQCETLQQQSESISAMERKLEQYDEKCATITEQYEDTLAEKNTQLDALRELPQKIEHINMHALCRVKHASKLLSPYRDTSEDDKTL